MIITGDGPDSSIRNQKVKRGTTKRIIPYTKPHRRSLGFLLVITTLNAGSAVAPPLLLKYLIDNGILARDTSVVVWISLAVAVLALVATLVGFAEAWYSAQVSEGLIYDLRVKVFDHVQRQPLAFFTRAQTGALVSRLNTDVIGAQQAVTQLLSSVVSSALTLVFILVTMFYLSWTITLISLVLVPFFILPGRIIGRRVQGLVRQHMQVNAEMGSMMQERFNVTGALLVKLYGRPDSETSQFSRLAGRGRDVGVQTSVSMKLLFLATMLVGSLATAAVYGFGGTFAIDGAFQVGTLVALATLLTRLMGPVGQLSNAQADAMTALVSFDRLFEVLDLKPLIAEKPGAVALPLPANGTAPEIEFNGVSFRYPKAADVSLASLESIAQPMQERGDNALTLCDLSFTAPAGSLTALVGPSGAGKTTITHLVPRLYDPDEGSVRIDGHDLRDLTLKSLHDTVGMVTQDAHLFHTTIRENLLYARPEATEQDLIEACRAAQIWNLIESLPNGLDTMVGDRGYRLSGGEKQRIAMARLLLKAPPVVVLDEATAHLDSESEAALQRALKTALAGRTSLVIAHRLSTIRDADQILVVDQGRIRERGTHEELLELDGLYAELYRTQFSRQSSGDVDAPAPERIPEPVGPPGHFMGPGGPGPVFHGPGPGGPGPGGPGPGGPGSVFHSPGPGGPGPGGGPFPGGPGRGGPGPV
ncbi:ABC transporter ATP-binding protein [Streptomyces sp. H27-D2]|uniref:ABC transporter ATP-binding protein n=1 Tax=Streptomyces sp. H27-D2 TaxID=3046304 RepID=UPI002DBD3EB0|nr:ABC transporter ATP-binding protein [Streptomyces sp. H27-D2]MEC4016324.1 ABC transporter ATP-binding protein [Streptomyces sp. H27-D2]